MALVQRWTKAREDATMAIAISGFFGLGIVLSRVIQNQPGGNRAGLDGFLFGKAATIVSSDAWLVLGVCSHRRCVCISRGASRSRAAASIARCRARQVAAGSGPQASLP